MSELDDLMRYRHIDGSRRGYKIGKFKIYWMGYSPTGKRQFKLVAPVEGHDELIATVTGTADPGTEEVTTAKALEIVQKDQLL